MRKPVQPIDGYIHKFRLQAHESMATMQQPGIGPEIEKAVHGGGVPIKFIVSALVLSALLSAVAWTFG